MGVFHVGLLVGMYCMVGYWLWMYFTLGYCLGCIALWVFHVESLVGMYSILGHWLGCIPC